MSCSDRYCTNGRVIDAEDVVPIIGVVCGAKIIERACPPDTIIKTPKYRNSFISLGLLLFIVFCFYLIYGMKMVVLAPIAEKVPLSVPLIVLL